jgi:hypothetical protein
MITILVKSIAIIFIIIIMGIITSVTNAVTPGLSVIPCLLGFFIIRAIVKYKPKKTQGTNDENKYELNKKDGI